MVVSVYSEPQPLTWDTSLQTASVDPGQKAPSPPGGRVPDVLEHGPQDEASRHSQLDAQNQSSLTEQTQVTMQSGASASEYSHGLYSSRLQLPPLDGRLEGHSAETKPVDQRAPSQIAKRWLTS